MLHICAEIKSNQNVFI
uniref:Uncharacterized protein n=1 Tax=Anguilla anguilla TaxID=7936 RepID=A0A0E9VGZ0_ANGAN